MGVTSSGYSFILTIFILMVDFSFSLSYNTIER
nr:MAG TPA: hypothetical protein [Caudoviricetes sp.]